jgi:peroxiredoxin
MKKFLINRPGRHVPRGWARLGLAMITLTPIALFACASGALAAEDEHPKPLAIGATAPDFHLPGIDGKTYSLSDFKNQKLLVVIFTAVHCPTAEVYEERIKKLAADYHERGVGFVVIQPNSPKALRLDEMGYTDLGDAPADMKIRAEYRHFNFPFLYDGETQEASRKYGPVATPHVFVFDQERKLRYEGRLDNSTREAYAKVPDARNALEAVLAGRPIEVQRTPAVGCSIKWMYKESSQEAEMKSIEAEPIPLEKVGPEQLRELRANHRQAGGKTLLVNFWATWCGPCTAEFPELQQTWRMYRKRPFELVTVSINYPDEEKGVRRFLDSQHASTRNLLFGSMDLYEEMAAFDPTWGGAVPYTVLIGPDGNLLYKEQGSLNIQKVRRLILASFPDDDFVGQHAYWGGN